MRTLSKNENLNVKSILMQIEILPLAVHTIFSYFQDRIEMTFIFIYRE
jgi:hypothetical protein